MANLIPWSDQYLIGIDEIDQQHKYLFELINESLQCDEMAKLKLSLIQLYKYTREHFKAEETLMKSISYGKYELHVQKHNELIIMLNNKSKEALDDPTKRDELDNFLAGWLIRHIVRNDLDISRFLKKRSNR